METESGQVDGQEKKGRPRKGQREVVHPKETGDSENTLMAGKRPHHQSRQIKLRLPEGIQDEIRLTAKENGRSMKAEIMARITQGPNDVVRSRWDIFAAHALSGLLAIGEHEDIATQKAIGIATAMVQNLPPPLAAIFTKTVQIVLPAERDFEEKCRRAILNQQSSDPEGGHTA